MKSVDAPPGATGPAADDGVAQRRAHVDLDAMLADAARPACLALGAIFALLVPLHVLTLPGTGGHVVAAVAVFTAAVLVGLGIGLGTRRTGPLLHSRATGLTAAVAALTMTNTLVHLAATGSPTPTANVVAAVVGVGAIVSARAHAVVLIALTDVAWAVIAVRNGFDAQWQQAASALMAGTVLAALLNVTRYRTALRLEEAKARLADMSVTDPLTGVRNRRGLVLAAEPLLDLARRDGTPVTVVCLDLDGLKIANDERGHAAGDRLIVSAARALTSVSRSSDVVARLGGDEFAVVLPGSNEGDARAFVERLHGRLAENGIAASVGVVHSTPPGTTESGWGLESLLVVADARMYEMKRRRRRAAGSPPGDGRTVGLHGRVLVEPAPLVPELR